MKRMPMTKGANAEKTTAEYGIVAMNIASRVVNRRRRRRPASRGDLRPPPGAAPYPVRRPRKEPVGEPDRGAEPRPPGVLHRRCPLDDPLHRQHGPLRRLLEGEV